MKNMDNETTLIIYGDHGMTQDGNHGGDSDKEVRTVLFSYSKGGFPMLQKSDKIIKLLETYTFDDIKLIDIASIVSNMLDIPIPFSSLGIYHPLFLMSPDLKELPQRMINNLYQIKGYITEYCQQQKHLSWCEPQKQDLSDRILGFEEDFKTLL